MDRDKFRKKRGGVAKKAWLDWLADDPPAPEAKEQLRERFKQQANSYQPVNRTVPQPPAAVPAVSAAPVAAAQLQAVSNTTSAISQPPAAPKSAAPATVSIQIHIPALQTERFGKLITKLKQGITTGKGWFSSAKVWFLHQLAHNRARTVGISIGIPVVLLLLLVPPLFNFGYGKPQAVEGSSSGASTGGVKYEKPSFDVVRPSNKPRLGTPDGVHAAYDGTKNTYSYSDSIVGNGITVSQQPLPAQFKNGETAVETIAPTINKGATPTKLKIITGTAYVSTNQKYGSQTVVASVRNILLFMQSAHAFKDNEWVDYINTLQ